MPWWVGLSLFFVGVLLLAILAERAHRYHIHNFFAPRAPLDDTSFHERYYRNSDIPPHISVAVRRILGTFLELPYEKIEPDMGLQDLVLGFDSLCWATFFMEVDNELGVTVTPEDAQRIRPTLRSLIEVITEVYRRQHPGNDRVPGPG